MSSKWPLLSLKKAGISLIDCDHKTPKAQEHGRPYIGIPQLKDGRITRDGARLISEADFHHWRRKANPMPDDVILSRRCNPGETAYVAGDFDFALGQNLVLLRSDGTKTYPPFLRWLTRDYHWWTQVNKYINVGAVFDSLKCAEIPQFEIYLPPLDEQKLIANFLGAIDEKIQLNHQINQTLEQMAQAIFKSWFVDFEPVKAKIAALEAGGSEDDALLAAMQAIAGSALFVTDTTDADAPTQLARLQTEHPEQYATLRATAELFPSAMQDSELGEIPAGWKVLPLSEMVELIGGGTPKRSEPAYWNGDICWFSVKDAPNDGNVFVIDTVEKITDAGLKGSSTKLLPLGTTIITARGTVGKLALTGVVTAMNQSCYGVIGAEGTGPYLNYLQMHKAVETLQRNTHGAVFDTITQATFGTVHQTQACVLLRADFENLVKPLFETIKNNLQQIRSLSELRDTLLPKLLSGELSISAATDQITQAEEAIDV